MYDLDMTTKSKSELEEGGLMMMNEGKGTFVLS
jgi:hypothetical protein